MSKKEKEAAAALEEQAATEEEKNVETEAEKSEKEISELRDKNLRLLAEFENYKKRTVKEKENAYDYAARDTISNILPVFDSLQLSLNHDDSNPESFKSGIELIAKQFSEALKKMGVSEIESLDKQFDPELHHAVMRDEESEKESGTIVEEFQKGYKLKENVIRHSMVKVRS